MKVVLLAGGLGTRISEETVYVPKPLIEIGGKPIIWHIMKSYSYYGHNEFIICAGYKQQTIKQWFADYFLNSADITFDYTNGEEARIIHESHAEPWKVTVVDTGLNTMTGGRIKRVQKYVGDESFLMTYGDGVCDVNVNDLISFHKDHGKIATLTAVKMAQETDATLVPFVITGDYKLFHRGEIIEFLKQRGLTKAYSEAERNYILFAVNLYQELRKIDMRGYWEIVPVHSKAAVFLSVLYISLSIS